MTAEEWGPDAQDAINAELVRCTLTGDDRPELHGELYRQIRELRQAVNAALTQIGQALVPVVQALQRAIDANPKLKALLEAQAHRGGAE